ncbi:hypothetical protein AK812_SmicGene39159 [Symbiodinium microadriaticum]|uniref:Uncharacterized protein n=1 Tax=Symbiodinium microadriaticum TaxID=2951 RepID=A0A1Q9CBY5_SYMMI|nr:hypothetical protein AK812_SmicGene39159 [Symbiodinium microadriaticum]CAE7213379.1 unnamed protein product [Symbiodinium sp. KB8]CAE7249374.1 unnamed protein product [Symbiodinium microadriaticum]
MLVPRPALQVALNLKKVFYCGAQVCLQQSKRAPKLFIKPLAWGRSGFSAESFNSPRLQRFLAMRWIGLLLLLPGSMGDPALSVAPARTAPARTPEQIQSMKASLHDSVKAAIEAKKNQEKKTEEAQVHHDSPSPASPSAMEDKLLAEVREMLRTGRVGNDRSSTAGEKVLGSERGEPSEREA